MVLPSDDPNIRYIEKHFNVQRDEDIINNVRNRVTAYEDSVRYHYEIIEMAACKDSVASRLLRESNEIKRKYNVGQVTIINDYVFAFDKIMCWLFI